MSHTYDDPLVTVEYDHLTVMAYEDAIAVAYDKQDVHTAPFEVDGIYGDRTPFSQSQSVSLMYDGAPIGTYMPDNQRLDIGFKKAGELYLTINQQEAAFLDSVLRALVTHDNLHPNRDGERLEALSNVAEIVESVAERYANATVV